MTRLLEEKEFKKTLGSSMTDVTESADPVVDIWDYVGLLVNEKAVDKYVLENNLIEKVYRNVNLTFDHVLLPTTNQNVFVVIVVSLIGENILGHYQLDLEKEYSL